MSTFTFSDYLLSKDGKILHIYRIGNSDKSWFDLEELKDLNEITEQDFEAMKPDSIKLYALLEDRSKFVWLVQIQKDFMCNF